MHADRHLAVQVALGDHVGAAGLDHSGLLQGLYEAPADGLVAVPSGHLLEEEGGGACEVHGGDGNEVRRRELTG